MDLFDIFAIAGLAVSLFALILWVRASWFAPDPSRFIKGRMRRLKDQVRRLEKRIEALEKPVPSEGSPAVVQIFFGGSDHPGIQQAAHDETPEGNEDSPEESSRDAGEQPPLSETLVEDKKDAEPEPEFAAMTKLYNQARHDEEERAGFKKHYRLFWLVLSNAVEHKKDPSLDPVFEQVQDSADGDYLAVLEPTSSGSSKHAVFPPFRLTITPQLFVDSAMDKLFETADPPSSGLLYRRFEVTKPAIFHQDAGQQWVMIKRGVLDLGPASS